MEDRLIRLEEQMLFIERQVEDLDDVVRRLADQLDGMQRSLQRLEARIEAGAEEPGDDDGG